MTPPAAPSAELAREFRARPYGRHSPDLQHLLNRMRTPSQEPYLILIVLETGRRWRLGQIDPRNGTVTEGDEEFDSLLAAEWRAFQIRWRALFGDVPPAD